MEGYDISLVNNFCEFVFLFNCVHFTDEEGRVEDFGLNWTVAVR
jgi:hypothetical protein